MAEEGETPKALLRRPELPDHLQFAWSAFSELSTDRPLGFGAAGPIPWSAISAYAMRHGVGGDTFERLLALIRAMDGEWLKDAASRRASI